MRIGIIQPGKIGDIVICLPIAGYLRSQGHEVVWPVSDRLIHNFEDIDYVKFHGIPFDCRAAHEKCRELGCDRVVDVSFTIPGADSGNSSGYLSQDTWSFDEYKYHLAGVPFDRKWDLEITRNPDRESALCRLLELDDRPTVLVQEQSSDYHRKTIFPGGIRRIDIRDIQGFGVFDWLGAMERAHRVILIESCFSNIVDQLGIRLESPTLLMKHGYYGTELSDGRFRGEPVLRMDWNRI